MKSTVLLLLLLLVGSSGALLAADFAITVPPPLNGPLHWTTGDAVVVPAPDARGIVSVKDPSIVRYNDRWHIYATTAATNGAWGMVYLSFADWADAASAKPYYLDQNPNLRGYHCAPQVFYFRPQKKWYLIYQSGPPQYSTTDDLAKPETWTKPENFFPPNPSNAHRNWLDFWIICDDTDAYLFCTGDNGCLYRSRTKLEDFPNGLSEPEVVIQGSVEGVFEGGMTYKIKGANAYLTLVEAIGPGTRYYRAWISDRLDGEWKPLPNAMTFEQPFAGINNVKFANGVKPWTRDISHGELIRDGYDQTPTIDPNNLQLLFQGRDPAINPSYSQLPYRLGLLRLNSPSTNPPSAASPSPRATLTAPVPAPYELATWRGFRACAVSYTFDDNSPKQFSMAQPMFDAKGLHATFFCIVGSLSPSQWTTIESASSKGHEIASHTLTHPDLSKLTDDQVAAEESGSKNLIESHTAKKCVSLAYPYCTVPKKSITSQFYSFARSCNGSLVPSTPSDFLSIGSLGPDAGMDAPSDSAASSGSWLVWLIHGIDNDAACCPVASSVLQSNLDYVTANPNKWWIETFGNVCRYIQERNVSVLTVVSTGATNITLRLTNSLDNTIFNYPVTLRRPMPSGWQAAAVTQNGASVPSQVVNGNLMFDVVPNGDDIVLSVLEKATSLSK